MPLRSAIVGAALAITVMTAAAEIALGLSPTTTRSHDTTEPRSPTFSESV